MNVKPIVLGLALVSGGFLVSAPAFAFSGVVSGTFNLWNKNGNFCDPGIQNCTGSAYTKSAFDTTRPLMNAVVEIWQGSGAIGSGVTDGSGNFKVSWSSGTIGTQAFVRWFSQQKDGRFVINDVNGLRMNTFSGNFTLVNGTTTTSPQNIGTWQGGTSASPQWWLNVYWAAELEWRTRFNLVGLLINNYTNIEIRGLQNNVPGFLGNCGTSCANGAQKRIQLDAGAGFAPQARIMHESGHVANYQARPFTNGGNYCWPNTSAPDGIGGGNPCGWSQSADDPEWAAAAFEEGLATFAGDSTLWFPNSPGPTSCLSSGNCPVNSSTRIEETHFPFATNNCNLTSGDPESRWALSAMRFLWDVYDTVNDCDDDTIGEGPQNYWRMYANMQNYAAGTSTNQIDEPWNSDFSAIDNFDGRGSSSYNQNYAAFMSLGLLRVDNCSAL